MVFSSILFLFRFLPVFLILYFAAAACGKHALRIQNLILFAGSLLFYAWGEPVYVLLMLFSITSNYVLGRMIGNAGNDRRVAKVLVWMAAAVNIGMLGFFKYTDFLLQSVNSAVGTDLTLPGIVLPIGISFYTFQALSYVIDVYRGTVEVQKNWLDFGTYVAMFPQLIAGPVVKYRTVAAQLTMRRQLPEERLEGIRRFMTGLGKKVLLANQAGALWQTFQSYSPENMTVMSSWAGIILFAFQIYYDFSGYSDMAVGLGKIFGFTFDENFRYPYTAVSVTDFWRRWHISLSSWFREYVYIPLGGNRRGILRQLFNILVVWTLTGIWHGAAWNFLLWGLWFALFLIMEKVWLQNVLKCLPAVVGYLYTMLAVLGSWVLFSLPDPGTAGRYALVMLGASGHELVNASVLYELNNMLLLIIMMAAGATPWPAAAARRLRECLTARRFLGGRMLKTVWVLLETVWYTGLFLLCVAFLVNATYNPFLYFRF